MKSNIGLPSSTVRSLAAVISLIMVFGITLGLTVPLIAIVLDGQGHSSVAMAGPTIALALFGIVRIARSPSSA